MCFQRNSSPLFLSLARAFSLLSMSASTLKLSRKRDSALLLFFLVRVDKSVIKHRLRSPLKVKNVISHWLSCGADVTTKISQSLAEQSSASNDNISTNIIDNNNIDKNNNCWFSHDVTKIQTTKLSNILLRFYFHDVLEELKTNFPENFRFESVLGFVIEDS